MRKTLTIVISIGILLTAIPAIAYRLIEAGNLLSILNLLGYFTIQSNIAVVFIIVCSLFGKRFSRGLEMVVAVAITVTAVVFQLFLRPHFDLSGFNGLVVNINHGTTTILYLCWFCLIEHEKPLRTEDAKYVLPYPIIYGICGIIETFFREEPRYFFLDVRRQGVFVSLAWVAGMAILFSSLSFLFILLDHKSLTSDTPSPRG